MERLNRPTREAFANRFQERLLQRPSQEHLQAKASCPKLSSVESPNGLPHGFKVNHPSNLWRVKQIPLIKWNCPPRLDGIMSKWKVAAGEESSEIVDQKQRELRVLEAHYPRSSAIPPNPASSVDNSSDNYQNALPVPIIPTEDKNVVQEQEDGSTTLANNNVQGGSTSPNNNVEGSQSSDDPLSFFKSATPEILSAAQGAVSTIMQGAVSTVMSLLDPRTLSDREWLLKILRDPKMVEQLLSTQSMHNVQSSSLPARPSTGMTDAAQNNMPSTSMQLTPHMSSVSKSSHDMANIAKSETVMPISMATTSICPPITVRTITKPSISDGAKATPHLLEMISSVEVLGSLGILFQDDFLVHTFLQSLPDSYSSFIGNLNMNEAKLSLSELLDKLKTFEEANCEDKTVLAARPSAGSDLKGETHRKKNKNNTSVSKPIPVNPKSGIMKKEVKGLRGVCFQCKQKGHYKRECKALEAENNAPGVPTSGAGMPH